MKKIGAIILTKTADRSFYDMTHKCIDTLVKSCENAEASYQIVVMESNAEAKDLGFTYQFENVETITPKEDFNFNRFYNIGMQHLDAEYLLFLNNDLIFHEDAIKRTLADFENNPQLKSASPSDPNYVTHQKYLGETHPIPGYRVRCHVCGWAIFAKREVFDTIGEWDEQFIFWYQDNDYAETIKAAGIKHALLPTVFVFHLESISHKTIPRGKAKEFKENMKQIFDNKWKQQSQNSRKQESLF